MVGEKDEFVRPTLDREKKEPEGKKIRTKRPTSKKWEYYKKKDGKLVKTRKSCPKCGPATFLADHGDREACGRCGYTVFKTKKKKEKKTEKKKAEKKEEKESTKKPEKTEAKKSTN